LKKKKILLLLAVLFTVLIVAAGCSGNDGQTADSGETADTGSKNVDENSGQTEKLKVGFVYVGSAGDAGWSYAHDQGRKYLEKEIPYVVSEVIENVPESTSEQAITTLAEKGNQVIFTTSFGFMDPTINVAQKYPDITFLHCSGYKTSDNVGTYFGRMYQARYLTGIVAGMMTKSNLIGYVAAYPIPEVIRGINAFTLGARSVNPDAKVRVVWTHTWFDPQKEKDAAKALLENGADIIAQHQDSPGPQKAAEEAGKYSIGYNSDMSKLAPKAVLTSAVWNWGPYYVETVKAIKEGTWQSFQYWGSMADGIVGLAPYGPMVPEKVKQQVEKSKEKIMSGEWDVFYGPIKDQDGNVAVQEGEKLTDKEMLEMQWFVEGVEGKIEK